MHLALTEYFSNANTFCESRWTAANQVNSMQTLISWKWTRTIKSRKIRVKKETSLDEVATMAASKPFNIFSLLLSNTKNCLIVNAWNVDGFSVRFSMPEGIEAKRMRIGKTVFSSTAFVTETMITKRSKLEKATRKTAWANWKLHRNSVDWSLRPKISAQDKPSIATREYNFVQ